MSDDKELEEMLIIMEAEKPKPNWAQINICAGMLANYEGERFEEFYNRFKKMEYK